MSDIAADLPTLTVAGQVYGGWTSMTISRSLDRMASHFEIEVSEAWQTGAVPWQIPIFAPVVVKLGQDVVLTGYVDDYAASFAAAAHSVHIVGRSRTADLIDCTPDIPSGQYRGYTLEAIARSIYGYFGGGVIVQADASQVFPDATLQRCETAFAFLERLGRLAGVLLTDDASGSLVLTRAGANRAAGALIQGQNILAGSARLAGGKRYSQYIVKGQRALGGGTPSAAAPAAVQTQLRAVALDSTVPRFRPRVTMAEAQLDQAGMQLRANWERNTAYGRGTEAQITVAGFRQPDGSLWAVNQLVTITSAYLHLDQDLLVASVEFRIDDRAGRTTMLKLGPIEGYTPDPGEVKIKAKRGRRGHTAPNWDGVGNAG